MFEPQFICYLKMERAAFFLSCSRTVERRLLVLVNLLPTMHVREPFRASRFEIAFNPARTPIIAR